MIDSYPNRKNVSLKRLADWVGGQVIGDSDLSIHGVAGIKEAKQGDITFLSNPRYANVLHTTKASAVIVSKPVKDLSIAALVVKDPCYAMSQIVSRLYQNPHQSLGVSSLSSIDKNVKLGTGVSIHPFVRIEEGAVIGNRVTLYPGVYIGKGSQIGEDSVIYANASIREKVTIGRHVIIHSGAVIGSDGFGFATHHGRHHKIPQIGTVMIADDVEIGANVTVDRAALGKTVIGRGTKIDNLVQVAHNVTVGEDCLLVAQVGISGSTHLGDRVILAGQAGLSGHLTIGDNVVVGAQAGVIRDISPNEKVSGTLSMPLRTWLEIQASLPHLPELRKRIRVLEKELSSIIRQKAATKPRGKKSKKKGERQ